MKNRWTHFKFFNDFLFTFTYDDFIYHKKEIKEDFKKNLKENSKFLDDIKFFIEFLRYEKKLKNDFDIIKKNWYKPFENVKKTFEVWNIKIFWEYSDEDEKMQAEMDKMDERYSDFCYSLYYN